MDWFLVLVEEKRQRFELVSLFFQLLYPSSQSFRIDGKKRGVGMGSELIVYLGHSDKTFDHFGSFLDVWLGANLCCYPERNLSYCVILVLLEEVRIEKE